MKVVYIAGPFRGETAWAVERNIRWAEEAAFYVWMLGHAALCPHTNTRFFNGEGTDQLWLDGTLELMRRCDGVLLIPGWQDSQGAVGEADEARNRGMYVYELDTDRKAFEAWLAG